MAYHTHSYPTWDSTRCRHTTGGYRSRSSTTTSLYQLVYHYLEQFQQEWEWRYESKHGYLRLEVLKAFEAYLDCGVYERGAARAHCKGCGHSIWIAFSCKARTVCPSCAAKRAVVFGEHLHESVLWQVPHQHVVFTIPKRIRYYFRQNRKLLPYLLSAAATSLKRVGGFCDEGVCGAVLGLHTAGETLGWHPHVHGIVTTGVFLQDATFVPVSWDTAELCAEFECELMRQLCREFDWMEHVYDELKLQAYRGFNVWIGDEFSSHDHDTRRFMGRYLRRASFAIGQITVASNEVVKAFQQ